MRASVKAPRDGGQGKGSFHGDSRDPEVERVDQASSKNQPPTETSAQPRVPPPTPRPMTPSGLEGGWVEYRDLPTSQELRQ